LVSADGWLCNLILFSFFFAKKRLYQCWGTAASSIRVFFFFSLLFIRLICQAIFVNQSLKHVNLGACVNSREGRLGKLHLPRLWFVGTVEEDLTDRFL
jgi:hypothetical protein